MAVFWDIDKKKNLRHEISRKFKILQNLGKKMNIGDSEAFLGLQAIFRILRWKLNILKYWRYRWICQTGQTVLWLCCAFTKLELDLSVNKCSIKCSISQYLQFLGRVQYLKNSFFSASDIQNPTSKKMWSIWNILPEIDCASISESETYIVSRHFGALFTRKRAF